MQCGDTARSGGQERGWGVVTGALWRKWSPGTLGKCWNMAQQREGERPREGYGLGTCQSVKRKDTGLRGTGRERMARSHWSREKGMTSQISEDLSSFSGCQSSCPEAAAHKPSLCPSGLQPSPASGPRILALESAPPDTPRLEPCPSWRRAH